VKPATRKPKRSYALAVGIALTFALALLLAFVLSPRGPAETETTSSVNQCASRLHSNYSPRNLDQCMDVCLACERGSTVTCSTACKLRGAT
jgi:hypothetical protein